MAKLLHTRKKKSNKFLATGEQWGLTDKQFKQKFNSTPKKRKKRNSKKPYLAYLKTAKWKSKRSKVLKRDNYQCTECNSKLRLQVHHTTYERIFKEKLTDLITLCRKCHNKYHRGGQPLPKHMIHTHKTP